MLGQLLSYAIQVLAFLPVVFVLLSYTLVILSFGSIAIRSVVQKRSQVKGALDSKSSRIGPIFQKSSKRRLFLAPNPEDGRDLFTRSGLEQEDLILHICSFLSPKSITSLSCVNRATNQLIEDNRGVSHTLWQSLWFRDYGTTLLEWDVSREAFFNSITRAASDQRREPIPTCTNLSALVTAALKTKNTRTFYFRFQLSFMDYILAGHNHKTKCLLGMHGHVFDFTDFAPHHPGLSEPILIDCGRDVTFQFEDIRHSKAARRIALKLCLILDKSYCNRDECGLVWAPRNVQNLAKFLRQSNTRPPPEAPNSLGFDLNAILPMKNCSPTWQQPMTLEKFRIQHALGRESMDFGNIRPFYDPFTDTWKGWYTKIQDNWKTIYVNSDFEKEGVQY